MKKEKNYFADTSFLIDLLKEKEEAIEIYKNSNIILTGTVCLFELKKRTKIEAEQIKESVEDFDLNDAEKASEMYRKLEVEGEKINLIDYLIAAQAANRDLTLLTVDRDFQKIEEIETNLYRKIED